MCEDVLERLQTGVEALDGEAHHIEETAANLFDGDHSYPFLDAIASGFVEGEIVVDIEGYLLVCKWANFTSLTVVKVLEAVA